MPDSPDYRLYLESNNKSINIITRHENKTFFTAHQGPY
jgi:hypothetical protein